MDPCVCVKGESAMEKMDAEEMEAERLVTMFPEL